MFKKDWHIKIALVIMFSFVFYLFWFFIMRETFLGSIAYQPRVPDYYDSLVHKQHSLNKEDLENFKTYDKSMKKYYFEINGSYYYILRDIIYTVQGKRIIELYPKSEGYFTHLDNLYYVYGEERETVFATIGGPVSLYVLKDYRYGKLNITELKKSQISRREYEKPYFQIRNRPRPLKK